MAAKKMKAMGNFYDPKIFFVLFKIFFPRQEATCISKIFAFVPIGILRMYHLRGDGFSHEKAKNTHVLLQWRLTEERFGFLIFLMINGTNSM